MIKPSTKELGIIGIPSLHPAYSVTFPYSSDTPVPMHSNHIEHTDNFDIHFDINNMAQPPPPPHELTAPELTYDSFCIQ